MGAGRKAAGALLAGGILLLPQTLHAATTIIIHNLDGAGEGFNDPTPFVPVGGNPSVTLGAARLFAFQAAASIWAARLQSTVTIEVDARFDPLTCSATSGVLGSAGASTLHRNFAGAPIANTFYPQALANALAAVDLAVGTSDINATFNGDVDNAACLGATSWYYGVDGNPGPNIDLVSVVLHELGHGLGFQTYVNLATGQKFNGADDTYERNIQQNGAVPPDYPAMTDAQRIIASQSDPNLVWFGTNVTAGSITLSGGVTAGHVQLFAPSPQQPGSSVSHFNTAATPNQLMEPTYTGPNHDPGLALALLRDIGWRVATAQVPTLTWTSTALLAAVLLGGAVRLLLHRRARARR